MSKPKEVTSIRVDPDLLKKVHNMGINVSALFTVFMNQIMKQEICPTCGQKIKK